MRATPFSGAVVVGTRVMLGTIFADATAAIFRPIHAGGAAVILSGDEPFYSQRAVVHAAKAAGTANLRAGSFALGTLAPHLAAERQYADVFAFVDYATVGDDVSEAEKATLKALIASTYGIDR